jgi:hypothetical protein
MMSLRSEHQAIFDNIFGTKFNELGLSKDSTGPDILLAEASLHVMNAPDTKGLYNAIAAEWLLGKDEDLSE